jgi:hypothetical protein
MFQHLLDDVKDSVVRAARLASVAAVMVVALFVAVSFLCAAAFICVFQRYGLITACLAGAAVFFLLGILCAAVYFAQKRHANTRAKAAKSATHNLLTDPMLLATGLQVARAVGFKRLLPILAIGGLALGFLAGRRNTDDEQS